MIAGTSKIDISPGKGIELAGYPHYPRHNTGVHDPLYATCLYLNDDSKSIMLISLDILFYSKKYASQVKKEISSRSDLKEEDILIACTHTHSGPWASGRLDIEALEQDLDVDEKYVETLNSKIVNAALTAYEKTFKAGIGSGRGKCGRESGVGGNRRDPEGISDPSVPVLGIIDQQGRVRSAVINYALHPTLLHADNTLVSADYPGYIRKHLSSVFPDAAVLFLQGCSGDQSTRYFRKGQSFDEAERIGSLIGAEAERVLKDISYKDKTTLRTVSADLDMKLRKFQDIEKCESAFKAAKAEYDRLVKSNAAYVDIQNANVKLLGAEDMLGYVKMIKKGSPIALLEEEKPVQIQVISGDGWAISAMPGEIFVQFGLTIKQTFEDTDIFVATVANGGLPGYVYTKEALETGGYETDTSMLSEEMGYIMADKAIELIESLEEGK